MSIQSNSLFLYIEVERVRVLVVDGNREDKERILLSVSWLDKMRNNEERVLNIVHKRIGYNLI